MKIKFLNYAMQKITETNKFDNTKLAELKYGLEAFYMLMTKLITIFLIALVLKIYKEFLLFLLLYSPLRGFGFGFHANSSIECWVISTIVFILIPLLSKFIIMPLYIIQIIIVISSIIYLIYGPADTEKKPLINKKKRLFDKAFLVITSIIYLFSTLILKNQIVINLIMFACLWEVICILPITYKLFHQTYNNYKIYLKKV